MTSQASFSRSCKSSVVEACKGEKNSYIDFHDFSNLFNLVIPLDNIIIEYSIVDIIRKECIIGDFHDRREGMQRSARINIRR